MKTMRTLSPMLVLLLAAGCASQPPVREPLRPLPMPAAPAYPQATSANGAIFQDGNFNPLFEDRKARMVGDVVTVEITERASASKSASTDVSRSSAVANSVSDVFGVPFEYATNGFTPSFAADGSSDFSGSGSSSQTNNFTTTLTAMVVEVLPNGNLIISGEKEVHLNQGKEYIRLAGIVRPESVSPENVVSSTDIAQARIEYSGYGDMNKAQKMAWLQRFFMSVWPL